MKLGELAKEIDGTVRGDSQTEITRCSSLERAQSGSVVHITKKKLLEKLNGCGASAAIIGMGMETSTPSMPYIETEDPALAFVKAIDLLHPVEKPQATIDPTAVIHPTAKIGEGCSIGPLVCVGGGSTIGAGTALRAKTVIGKNCTVGDGCTFYAGVVVYDGSAIGSRVILHSGAVIGADGFRYVQESDKTMRKTPHIGIVRIGDDVEIGANSCIDRAMLDETVIGNGVKLDNLVQVGHNTVIGDNTVIAGLCGISGSCKIGKNVIMGGQVGVADHVEIPDGTVLAGKTGAVSTLEKPGIYSGMPAQPLMGWRKSMAAFRRGPEILKRLKKLENE
ncbi:MAG: UDP-3-O-(3-hydroxymyristoyl)glucosamine N-acyltransferase [Nitrospinota bacterium]